MNETEIRDRVQQALGDSSYPPDLPRRLTVGLERPAKRGPSPIYGFVAALLVLAIVGTLVFIRLQTPARPLPAESPLPVPSPQPSPVADVVIPQYDLDRADLSTSGDLVTPLNLTSTDSGRAVTLIGAYADSSRTVLFLRTLPAAGLPNLGIYDGSGFLNASSSAGPGIVGDSFFILNTGPHAASDGLARVRVVISSFVKVLPPEPQQTPPAQQIGNWTFEFPLRVQASFHLRLGPPLTSVGSWRFSIEAFEVTSSEVHFQAVIDGAAVDDIKQDTVSLTDLSGKALPFASWSAGTTVPKSQIGSSPPRNTRVNLAWRRPATGGPYMLNITGGGGHYVGGIDIPDPVTGKPITKGTPLAPTDYPASDEAITFDGAYTATVTSANPRACGYGSGSEGVLFEFGMWFQVNQAWYQIDFSTDPRVRQYSGPGTYDVKAQIWPSGGSNIFEGTARLTVTSDHYPGPYTGRVSGTLTWTGAAAQPQTVNVAGSWKCKPGGQLGPG